MRRVTSQVHFQKEKILSKIGQISQNDTFCIETGVEMKLDRSYWKGKKIAMCENGRMVVSGADTSTWNEDSKIESDLEEELGVVSAPCCHSRRCERKGVSVPFSETWKQPLRDSFPLESP